MIPFFDVSYLSVGFQFGSAWFSSTKEVQLDLVTSIPISPFHFLHLHIIIVRLGNESFRLQGSNKLAQAPGMKFIHDVFHSAFYVFRDGFS